MHRCVCEQYSFCLYNICFQCCVFRWKSFQMPVRKRRQKQLRVSNLELLFVVFGWRGNSFPSATSRGNSFPSVTSRGNSFPNVTSQGKSSSSASATTPQKATTKTTKPGPSATTPQKATTKTTKPGPSEAFTENSRLGKAKYSRLSRPELSRHSKPEPSWHCKPEHFLFVSQNTPGSAENSRLCEPEYSRLFKPEHCRLCKTEHSRPCKLEYSRLIPTCRWQFHSTLCDALADRIWFFQAQTKSTNLELVHDQHGKE